MARSTRNQDDAEGAGFKQQDASAWISFDPGLTGHRKDVRSAAAKSSAAARKATIARKLALNTDCTASRARDAARRSKKRRMENQDGSPASASSTATLHSRRQSEISLSSLAGASTNSPTGSSRTGSPGLMQPPLVSYPMSLDFDTPAITQESPAHLAQQHTSLQRAVAYVLGMDESFAQDHAVKEPTQFGALRIKSMGINSIHDAVASCRMGSGPLLAVALLAAWDLRFGDERSSLMHLRAWHQLALPQNVLPQHDGFPPANVTIVEAIRISLQCHLPPDVCLAMSYVLNQTPNQVPSHQAASGREIVSFFETISELVDATGVP